MGGSKISSIGNSSRLSLPRCGCNEPMKMWVSNTIYNPNRKFWKYHHSGKELAGRNDRAIVNALEVMAYGMAHANVAL
ncbi:hypothetical protein KIW84_046178 [Lathyrus oleraceus]|uniref:Uncharacterized protein n=1 Tax=Pisum sativum TaxID=3888 RepID=A0A9D4XMJ1_PEA|nr:hypothetical protein KIW84_046178 [Pisum sativum]